MAASWLSRIRPVMKGPKSQVGSHSAAAQVQLARRSLLVSRNRLACARFLPCQECCFGGVREPDDSLWLLEGSRWVYRREGPGKTGRNLGLSVASRALATTAIERPRANNVQGCAAEVRYWIESRHWCSFAWLALAPLDSARWSTSIRRLSETRGRGEGEGEGEGRARAR